MTQEVSARAVAAISKFMALGLGVDPTTVRLCELAGLLHDIGQASAVDGVSSNEISYAAMSVHAAYKLLPELAGDQMAVLQQALLWQAPCHDKVPPIPREELVKVLEQAASRLGVAAVLPLSVSKAFTPADVFTNSQQDPRDLIVRTCVAVAVDIVIGLRADRTSAIADGAEITGVNEVLDVVRGVGRACQPAAPMTQINTPDSADATASAVSFACCSKRRLLVVCPRNVIAEIAYGDIVTQSGQDQSVELHLAGTRQRSYNVGTEGAADVTVTNVDTVLKPWLRQVDSKAQYAWLAADVLLLESHELVAKDSALFAAARTWLRARSLCSSSTTCVSATPSYLLAGISTSRIQHVPEKHRHCASRSNKPFLLSLHTAAKIDDVPDAVPNSLTILNSVRNAQAFYRRSGDGGTLVHSKFTDADRRSRTEALLARAAHGSTGLGFVVSGPVLQAALPLAFASAHLSSAGAEADVQAIRAVSRGSNYQVHLYDIHDRGERASISMRWSLDLQEMWFRFLCARYGDDTVEITADDVYDTYNTFRLQHYSSITARLDRWHNGGTDLLRSLAPRVAVPEQMPTPSKRKSKTSRPTLRHADGAQRILVRYADTLEWLDVDDAFATSPREFARILEREVWLVKYSERKRVIRSLPREVARAWANENGSTASRVASYAKTPMPVLGYVYSRELGLVRSGDGCLELDLLA